MAGDGEEARGALADAVLALVVERGFRELTLQDVLDRTGSSNRAFHRYFESVADAFAAAYERLTTDSRGLFRVLLVEYRVAGGRSLDIHERFCERMTKAIDAARGQRGPQLDPPSLAPSLVLGAIEFAAADRVMRGEAASSPELAAELAYFGALMYFGDETAREELGDSK